MSTPLQLMHEHPIGLGCMNLSHGYEQPLPNEEAVAALHAAFDLGYRHFDTATLYGGGENEKRVGTAFKSMRSEIFLASKCGLYLDPEKGKSLDGRPEAIKAQCEASLKRLSTDHIDLYYLHRLDRNVPIEESAGALADLIREGKIGHYGLSEMSAQTIKRAHKEAPVTAVQSEYSLWTRNPEIAVLETCKSLGITFVAFSPLGRGFFGLSTQEPEKFTEFDMRRSMPRFLGDNFVANQKLLTEFKRLAQELECSCAQLALAWLHSKAPDIVSIPGTRRVEHMRENFESRNLRLNADQLTHLDDLINQHSVSGGRYSAAQQKEIDTEEF